jgi:hypothetical protein
VKINKLKLIPSPSLSIIYLIKNNNTNTHTQKEIVDLSSPTGRGGHTLVSCDSNTMIAFGGYSCDPVEQGDTPKAFSDFSTSLNGSTVNYFNTVLFRALLLMFSNISLHRIHMLHEYKYTSLISNIISFFFFSLMNIFKNR